MIKLKSLLTEGNSNPLISRLLKELQPLIDDIIEKTQQFYKQKDKVFSDYDAYFTEITLKFDMVKALEKYTLPTDTMSNVNAKNSDKGSLQLSCTIEREGTKYPFNTEVIYAGGYNIQKLHFRYLTKTTLPTTGQSVETQKLKAELIKLSKGEKLQKEMQSNQTRIEYNQKLVDANSKFNDKQIWDKLNSGDDTKNKPYIWPIWKDLSDSGKENYNNDEKDYNQKKKKSIEDSIQFWKMKNIKWPNDSIKIAKEEIVKLRKKLDTLV